MWKDYSNISGVVNENLCLSCGACTVICENDAILFSENPGGLIIPKVNNDLCIDCKRCLEVCPGIRPNESSNVPVSNDLFVGDVQNCYVGKANDDLFYSNSQSGGISTAIINYLISEKGYSGAIVVSMGQQSPPRPYAFIARNREDLILCQKSKYSPVPLLQTLKSIQGEGGTYALVGLPCHIHGLSKLIIEKPEFDKILGIKIGLVCERVLSNLAIDFIGRKATNRPINNLIFKDKKYYEYPGNTVVSSVDGDEFVLDMSLRMDIKDIFTPVRCRLCYDKLNTQADIVVGDPHGLSQINRLTGEGLVISRTEKGDRLLNETIVEDVINIRHADLNEVINGQGIKKKKKDWNRYVNSWALMGGVIPDYPESMKINTFPFDKGLSGYVKNLKIGLELCNEQSRERIMNSSEKRFKKKGVVKTIKAPIVKILKILSKTERS